MLYNLSSSFLSNHIPPHFLHLSNVTPFLLIFPMFILHLGHLIIFSEFATETTSSKASAAKTTTKSPARTAMPAKHARSKYPYCLFYRFNVPVYLLFLFDFCISHYYE